MATKFGTAALAALAVVAALAACLPACSAANPHYQFSYGVSDPQTGDVKQHSETRVGGAVEGSYSLLEPGGGTRTVHYTADDLHGFSAVVQRGGGHQVQVAHTPAAALVPSYISAPSQASSGSGKSSEQQVQQPRSYAILTTELGGYQGYPQGYTQGYSQGYPQVYTQGYQGYTQGYQQGYAAPVAPQSFVSVTVPHAGGNKQASAPAVSGHEQLLQLQLQRPVAEASGYAAPLLLQQPQAHHFGYAAALIPRGASHQAFFPQYFASLQRPAPQAFGYAAAEQLAAPYQQPIGQVFAYEASAPVVSIQRPAAAADLSVTVSTPSPEPNTAETKVAGTASPAERSRASGYASSSPSEAVEVKQQQQQQASASATAPTVLRAVLPAPKKRPAAPGGPVVAALYGYSQPYTWILPVTSFAQ